MEDHLNTTRDRVEHILKTHEATRDSDKLLWITYIRIFLGIKRTDTCEILFNKILNKEVPTFETLSRCRRKLQEKGFYQGKRYGHRQQLAEDVSNWAVEDTL